MSKKTNKSLWFLAVAMVAMVGIIFASKLTLARAEQVAAKSGIEFSEVSNDNAQNFTYNGKHSDWVRKLLTRVGGWRCPANASDSGTTPTVKSEECMRDKYVAAAVLYAWAAECYARNEEDSKAEQAAVQMYEQLKSAQGLCSDSPSIGGSSECDTERIYRCGEL